jgi:hypothetical protein
LDASKRNPEKSILVDKSEKRRETVSGRGSHKRHVLLLLRDNIKGTSLVERTEDSARWYLYPQLALHLFEQFPFKGIIPLFRNCLSFLSFTISFHGSDFLSFFSRTCHLCFFVEYDISPHLSPLVLLHDAKPSSARHESDGDATFVWFVSTPRYSVIVPWIFRLL